MKGKGFFMLLVAVLVLGAALGGTFVGGIALGKAQGDDDISETTLVPDTTGLGQGFQGQFSQEQLDAFRQQFQEGDGLPDGFPNFGGGRGGSGLAGTIESLDGNSVTITTAEGPVQVTIGDDTTIQVFGQGGVEDLEAGLQVTVVGQRGEDGTVEAQTIVINPLGVGGFGGGGFPSP